MIKKSRVPTTWCAFRVTIAPLHGTVILCEKRKIKGREEEEKEKGKDEKARSIERASYRER